MPSTAAIPDWLVQQDAREASQLPQLPAQPQGAPQGAPAQQPLPDWLLKQDAAEAAAQTPESVTVTANRDPSAWGDVAANIGTGLARVPGAVIGTPHMLAHTVDWLLAHIANTGAAAAGKDLNLTGADVDKHMPLPIIGGNVSDLPTGDDIDNGVFKGISALAGHDVQPYEPTSVIGKLAQAGITGAGAGLLDPAAFFGALKTGAPIAEAFTGGTARVAKTALASSAAEGTQQVFPNTPALAAAAALATHTGAGLAGDVARAGGGVALDATRQIFSPTAQGEREAGRLLTRVDNTQPGIAKPTDAELTDATGDVRAATDAIGPGQQPWMAGAEVRSGLQSRANAVKAARSAAGAEAFDAFRAEPALPTDELQGFMRSPSFRKAVGSANAAMLDEGKEPLTDFWDFDAAGDPTLKAGAAVPPDVLGRVKSWLGSAAANAPAGSADARTASILDKRFGDFMEQRYPASGDFPGYAAARQAYSDAGAPLGDFAHGSVAKALDADRQYGQTAYKLADERVPDLFLRGKATRTDLNQLVSAHGGDRAGALGALEDHLAGVAQTAVGADGTLDAAAFDRAMKPYKQSLGNVGLFFPELNQKFNTAKQAQGTLDTLQHQRTIADAVAGGALRDGDGVVTGASFGKWLRASGEALAKTQSPTGVMRLQSIANALQKTHPGELADVLKSEWAPTALGMATGGLEGGVLATLLHKSAQTAFGGLDAKRQAAFSSAIEKAVADPSYAARLASSAAKQGRISPVRALIRAIAATPLAVSAARP